MSTNETKIGAALLGQALDRERKHWWLFMLLGAVLVISGIVAIAYPCVTSVAAVTVFGILLIVSGLFTIIGAFWAGKWSGLLLQLLVGILYIMAGMAIRDAPLESTEMLTLLIATFFIVVGAFRVVVALVERFPQWGWALLNGVVTLLAGVIIYDSFKTYSALWVIGLLLGLELLFNGWTWIMLAVVIRNLPDEEEENAAPAEQAS